jgi:hypothetical protein
MHEATGVYSMTMKVSPRASSMAKIVTMFGWLSADAARASRTSLCRALGSEAARVSRLMATTRPRRSSSALCMVPIPPSPIFSSRR